MFLQGYRQLPPLAADTWCSTRNDAAVPAGMVRVPESTGGTVTK